MTNRVPTPLAAATGLALTTVEELRRLPVRLLTLPISAVGTALTAVEVTSRRYDGYARKGLGWLHGRAPWLVDSPDSSDATAAAADGAQQPGLPGWTGTGWSDGLAPAEDREASDAEVEAAIDAQLAADLAAEADTSADIDTRLVPDVPGDPDSPSAAAAPGGPGPAETGLVGEALTADSLAELSDGTAGRTAATSAASFPGRVEASAAATTGALQQAADAAAEADAALLEAARAEAELGERIPLDASGRSAVQVQATSGALLAHDELPLPDYDHLTLGSLRARMRGLDAIALRQLLEYEQAHADRLSVVRMLENRLSKVGDE